MSDKKIGVENVPSGYLLVQSALLFSKYGLGYEMPTWVTWFPTYFCGLILVIVLFVLLVIAIVGVLK